MGVCSVAVFASFARFGKDAMAAVLCAAALCGLASGQETGAAGVAQTEAAGDADPPDEVVVTGRNLRERRHEVEAAELAVFDRFNDINSDDRFDIHCFWQVRYFSHVRERVCRSNSWRDQEANYSDSLLRELRGEATPSREQFRGEQARVERLLETEMRRLLAEDPELRAAVTRLNQARAALGEALGAGGVQTASLEVPPSDGLPFGAKRAFVVRIGREPWSHALEQRTFTMAEVNGKVRKLELACGKERKRLDYQPAVDWSIPSGADACTLLVDAKPETTFALYEFE